MPGNQELFAPVFIGLQLDFMLKKVTTQLPYSFPFRGKVGMGARTMQAIFQHLPPPQTSPDRGGSKASTC